MKKLITLVFALCVCLSAAIAQNVPQGMQYQAVARDNSGKLIVDQEVSLRITLKSKSDRESTPYSEVHNVSTNLVGLFTLVIGQGESVAGSFEKIPWSSSDVWMEIEILDSESGNFQTISNSKMLSVPYAFHAGTAADILGAGQQRGGDGPVPGETSKNWLTNGNDNIRAGNVLGTNTPADLMIVTDGQTRIEIAGEESGVRVTADFSVVRQYPTKLTGTLQVDGESNLNNSVNVNNTSPTNLTGTLNVDGQADFNSALYVNNMSPTFLSGALTVDGETELYDKLTVFNKRPVLFSGTLTVDLATDLNTSLNVDGITDLNSALYVNNASPTVLSGTLQGVGTATFNDKVVLDNASYNSTSIDNGALVVAGGVGIGKNINVGGDAAFEGDVSIAGPLALGDPTESTDILTGALTVVGGAGIGKNVNVGGKMTVGSALNSTDFPLAVQGSTQGIKVTINGSRSNATDFVSFFDATGMQGRIEGQTSGELGSDPGYVRETGFLSVNSGVAGTQLALAITDNVIAGFELAQAIVGLTAASTSATACVGLGACVTAPIPSFIISDGLAVVLKTANLAKTIANTVIVQVSNDNAYAQEAAYESFRQATIGVTYQSGAADYAEWILRESADDDLYPGEVVGVTGGKVSRRTSNADHIMVVSSKPIILGNMPEPGKEKAYEKVAFMGQVR